MSERTEDCEVVHLEMWIDDLRKTIKRTREYGDELEQGYPLFCLIKQKLDLEIELLNIKRESK